MAWDVKNWDQKFIKTNRMQKLTNILDLMNVGLFMKGKKKQ